VRLGARSSVWFSAVIRADMDRVELGEESNLQDGSVIHVDEGIPTLVGRRVTIGHRAIVHGATVEDGCLIGMGAILLNGARIGAGSLVAAGALVREGQVVPPGSLVVGAPARVLGPVTADHTAAITRGVDHYVELAAAYRARGYVAGSPAGGGARAAAGRARGRGRLVRAPLHARAGSGAPRQDLEAIDGRRLAARPPGGGWSALEVLAHLRDVEAEVYAPRLAQFLAGPADRDAPLLAGAGDVDARNAAWAMERAYDRTDPAAALAAFARARGENLARLEALGPSERARAAIHPFRGPMTLFEQVERMAEHDLSHTRQIERALAAAGA